MNLVCIATSRIPSDTANSIQVMKVCHALACLGHSVHLLAPGSEPVEWPVLAEQYGLSVSFQITWLPSNPRLKRNDFAWFAVRWAKQLGADLVYTWVGQSAVLALLAGMPVIYEVHDLPTGKIGPLWFRAFLRLSGKKRLLPITQALQQRLEQAYPALSTQRGIISPNGVDLEMYQGLPDASSARQALALPGLPAERLTVLCAGHLYAGRGADLFLELAGRHPQATFVWVGGRPEDVAAYQKAAQEKGIQNTVFTGFISQRRLPAYQAAADVLLMPYGRSIAGSSGGNSVEICSPMKMFDYLAAGRAILTSDLPVIHEVLNDDNAVFAPPEDLQGWSAALERLFADEALRTRLGRRAASDAERYSWLARQKHALAGFLP
jgi:glycosyltransferase involved in cell wall biosynthesis